MATTEPFSVAVSRDWRDEADGFLMGLEALFQDDRIETTFLRDADAEGGPLTADEIAGADAIVSLVDEITQETLAVPDPPRIIAKFGAGFDNIDLDACTERGIPVTNAPQAPTDSVAQTTLGMLIACASNLRYFDNHARERGLDGPIMENRGVELFGKTVGVIGLGLIGRRLLDLLDPFDVSVQVYDPYVSTEVARELGVDRGELDAVVSTADFLSIHCPLTDETRGMLTEDHFRAMKPSAYLVNASRGGIYRDEVLAKAVREGWIAGAAVDVFEHEPDIEGNPLLALEDCLVTPHIAGLTDEALTRYGELCAESILRVRDDDLPRNLLNPSVYDRAVPDELRSPSYRG